MCLWLSGLGTFESTGLQCQQHGGHRLVAEHIRKDQYLGWWPRNMIKLEANDNLMNATSTS